jgi:hypothetical protein
MQRIQSLRLYRNILKEAAKIYDYSLQAYIRRRSGEVFRENAAVTDQKKQT